jgi:hypothetical protein
MVNCEVSISLNFSHFNSCSHSKDSKNQRTNTMKVDTVLINDFKSLQKNIHLVRLSLHNFLCHCTCAHLHVAQKVAYYALQYIAMLTVDLFYKENEKLLAKIVHHSCAVQYIVLYSTVYTFNKISSLNETHQ